MDGARGGVPRDLGTCTKGENMKRQMMQTAAAAGIALASVFGVMAENTDGWESELVTGLSLTDGNSETLMLNVGAATKNIQGSNFSVLVRIYLPQKDTIRLKGRH